MLQKYSFFCVFALLLTGLHWWSIRADFSPESGVQEVQAEDALIQDNVQDSVSQIELRRELVESLDRLVILENYYRSVYGHYTQVLNHAGFYVPARLVKHYEIRVVSAARNHFQVTAFSEERGRIQDRIWVDELFRVTANFSIPSPNPEYLKLRAAQHLKFLGEQKPVRLFPEKGIFTGFFRYEIRRDSGDRPVAVATGIKSPVQGLQLENDSKSTLLGESHPSVEAGQVRSMSLSENVGQYAPYVEEWSELAHLAENQYSDPASEVPLTTSDRHLAGEEVPRPSSERLVIESVDSAETISQ